ncbi:Sphingolipid delta(4)-desaturase/C4-hydroxylase DES2 [Toxocara canis]|uniref:sphingolipid 4-desaturase n=1 Tax=Toxocara canis TaxID=6265 RepID=A0A0B2VIF6_TOXCA|nr:Sphingolipid delta(4)-desaturase/C4-hydroxylase DES2 [Toxocara canis]
MGQHVSRNDFMWTYTEQPHMSRRQQIVTKYPKVKELFGIDPSFKYVVTANVLIQTLACFLLKDSDWALIILQAYFFGGVINHGMTLAIHDISHNVVYGNQRPLANRLFGIFANLPIGVPISVSFKKYHVEHHRYLGEEALDTDVPTDLEGRLFTTPMRKFIWLILQPFFYAFRPLIIYRKAPTDLELLNAVVQIIYDFFIFHFCGMKAVFYLIFGSVIAMGVHPSAGHFISEHYVFVKDQETYSYYGLWNLVTYNVGYHVEHHDFPYVPGRNLPQIRAMAPEFYKDLCKHNSWVWVLYQFVVNPALGPYARLKRKPSIPQQFYGNNMLGDYLDAFLMHIGYFYVRDEICSLFTKTDEKHRSKSLKVE